MTSIKGECEKTPHKKTDKPALAGFIGLFVGTYFTAPFMIL